MLQKADMKRQRATVIVEIDSRILLVENRGGLLLLPGGGINPAESHLQAAARELAEETRLIAESMLFLFSHESPTNCHSVFWAAASGLPFAGDDATALHLFEPQDLALTSRMSRASRQIIDRFLRTRGEAAANCSARMSGTSAAGHDTREVETLSGAYI